VEVFDVNNTACPHALWGDSHLLARHWVVDKKWAINLGTLAGKLNGSVRVCANVSNGEQPALPAFMELLHLRGGVDGNV
jgi:hypothetical protein